MPITQQKLGAIGQITNTVSDVPRAVAFYRDAMGLTQLPIPAPPTMAFFDCAGTRLMLSLPEPGFEARGSVLYFKVEEIQTVYDLLSSRGVGFLGEPHMVARMPDHELWMAFFRDPDGNPLALMCEART
jgi:methylmalonyl-CoA/ethylmalonyl-CoA epimerase